MADTAKLRELRSDRRYTPLGFFAKEDEQGQTVLFDSQQYLIEEAQRRHLAAAEKEAARDANRRRTAGAGADAAGMPPVEASPTEAVGEEVAELVELIEQAATQASAHEQEESVQLGAGGVSAARPGAEDASERQPEAVVAPEPQPEAVAAPKPRAAVEPTAATRPGGRRRAYPCGGFRVHEYPGQRASCETRRQAGPARTGARPHPALLAPPSSRPRAFSLPRAAPPACRRRFVRTAGRDRALRRARQTRRTPPAGPRPDGRPAMRAPCARPAAQPLPAGSRTRRC